MGLLAGVIALMVFVDPKQQAVNLILGTWMTNKDECSAKHTRDFLSRHLCLDRFRITAQHVRFRKLLTSLLNRRFHAFQFSRGAV